MKRYRERSHHRRDGGLLDIGHDRHFSLCVSMNKHLSGKFDFQSDRLMNLEIHGLEVFSRHN